MKTIHRIVYGDSRNAGEVSDGTYLKPSSVHLMVTSPPYPMIEMWDEVLSQQNEEIGRALDSREGDLAFNLMHEELDKVWTSVYSALIPGGIGCISIGDATRKLDDSFKLYSNHSRVLSHCMSVGFHVLPEILWRKRSNKPNKFMGSGMLPAGAYITQEHEYILILRKDRKRSFESSLQKKNRQRSAYFWEERNNWFSDIWEDLRGGRQALNHVDLRKRSAAYPFELCYRLISMFSVQGDTVVDPFLGTGTTMLAAMVAGRNSIGIEVDRRFKKLIDSRLMSAVRFASEYNNMRLQRHQQFVSKMEKEGKKLRHENKHYGFPVMTGQETRMKLHNVKSVGQVGDNVFEVEYA